MQVNDIDIEMLFDKNSSYREKEGKMFLYSLTAQTVLQIFIKGHQ